jgi:hypothetical protein
VPALGGAVHDTVADPDSGVAASATGADDGAAGVAVVVVGWVKGSPVLAGAVLGGLVPSVVDVAAFPVCPTAWLAALPTARPPD